MIRLRAATRSVVLMGSAKWRISKMQRRTLLVTRSKAGAAFTAGVSPDSACATTSRTKR